MDLKQIADELVDGCRTGRELENLDKLYAPDAVSVEAVDYGGQGREVKGIEGIKGKHAWWNGAMTATDSSTSDPMLHGEDRFAVIFEVKGHENDTKKPFEMKEVAVYHVDGGKITREEFFGM